MSAHDPKVARFRSTRFGWVGLLVWSVAGLGLEAAHALKWAAFFDDELVHLLLRLAHAHGALLSLVVLAHASTASRLSDGRVLRAGALLLPIGFLLGAIGHPEGDPSYGIVLAPIGGLLLLAALARIAWHARRDDSMDR